MIKLEVFKLNPDAITPTRANANDAGADLYAAETAFIPVGKTVKVSTGVALRVANGFVGKIEDRSSMSTRGIRTGAGIVDAGFSGEVSVVLHNLNNTSAASGDTRGYLVQKGDKIAQMLIIQVATPDIIERDTLWISERGNKGWGSSGV